MGFFDKVKSVAMKAKCGAGIHGGDYHNVEGKPKCYFEKTCPDCKEIIKKNEHKFGKATYIKEDSCKQEKTCMHCGHIEKLVKHAEYKQIGVDDRCNVKEQCIRCGDKRVHGTKHSWEKNPTNYNSNTDTFWCIKCGKEETRAKKVY